MNSFLEKYLPDEYLKATYKGIPFNKGKLSKEEGTILSAVRRAEADPLSARPQAPSVQPLPEPSMNAYGINQEGQPTEGTPNLPGLLNIGIHNMQDAFGEAKLGVTDAIAGNTGLDKYQAGLLNSTDPGSFEPNDLPSLPLESETPIVEPDPVPEIPAVTGSTTLQELHEIEVTAQKRKAVETQNQLAQQGAASILQNGGSEKELKGWERFTKEFDLQALGMALMATSGNGEGLIPNLGTALMYGKAARDAQIDGEIAAQAEARKENRAERGVQVKEAGVLLTAERDANSAALGERRAAAAELTANAAMIRAKKAGTGGGKDAQSTPPKPNATVEGLFKDFLRRKGSKMAWDDETNANWVKGASGELNAAIIDSKKPTSAYYGLRPEDIMELYYNKQLQDEILVDTAFYQKGKIKLND